MRDLLEECPYAGPDLESERGEEEGNRERGSEIL